MKTLVNRTYAMRKWKCSKVISNDKSKTSWILVHVNMLEHHIVWETKYTRKTKSFDFIINKNVRTFLMKHCSHFSLPFYVELRFNHTKHWLRLLLSLNIYKKLFCAILAFLSLIKLINSAFLQVSHNFCTPYFQ